MALGVRPPSRYCGRYQGQSRHGADTANRSFLTHTDNLQLPITASRKDHSIISSAMDQDKPRRLHELDAQVAIAALRDLAQ